MDSQKIVQWIWACQAIRRNQVQGIILVNFQNDKMTKNELLYTDWELLKQSTRQSERTVLCGQLYISGERRFFFVKQALNIWVIHHPHVVKSKISNDRLKVYIHGKTEKKLY